MQLSKDQRIPSMKTFFAVLFFFFCSHSIFAQTTENQVALASRLRKNASRGAKSCHQG